MSDKYSISERFIARVLSAFPRTKSIVKVLYSFINLIIHRKKYSFKTEYKIKPYFYKDMETFFGYYDKTPYNMDKTYLIFNATPQDTSKKPNPNKELYIILFDVKKNRVKCSFRTKAYNWQQGSKAMWIDNEHFLFNDYLPNKDIYVARVVNVCKGEVVKTIDFPIYDALDKKAYSLSFDRLALLRPDYGYFNRIDKYNLDSIKYNLDGIFSINLTNGSVNLILSLSAIIEYNYIDDFSSSKHKVNHIMISPNSEYILFLHRWYKGKQRFDRLMVVRNDGTNLRCLSSNDMVSHCFWLNNTNVLGYLRDKNQGDNYYFINIETGVKTILNLELNVYGDGHPSTFDSIMLFDTYPNKARMKGLFLYDIKENMLEQLGEFYEPLKFSGESRCDLHPRWSPDGQSVFIDSVHSGKRLLYELILSK